MKDIQEEIQKNTQASVIVGLVTIILVTLLLRLFMRATVLKPLDVIGGVADKIGEGDLSVHAQVKSQDEIGVLAERINKIIKGLQERLHLTKFVSDEALTAVKKVGLEGLKMGGERKVATIMETDIRGFTSMSEKMEPEEVVSLLNTYLDKQTEVINSHGGDIDKFIGYDIQSGILIDYAKGMDENAVIGVIYQDDDYGENVIKGVEESEAEMIIIGSLTMPAIITWVHPPFIRFIT